MLLNVDSLSVRRHGSPILTDINLELGSAELVALIGANSAGKTTLLRALSGTVSPSGGTIELLGRNITRLSTGDPARAGLAHVPEGGRLFDGLTVRENLLLGGWRSKTRDLFQALELLPELKPLLDQRASTLSSAHVQLCAIGRALVGDPAVLLIDEISLGLAPRALVRLLDLLPELVSTGIAVLFVEQDVGRALSMADRVYLLERGRITREGQPGELLADAEFVHAHVDESF